MYDDSVFEMSDFRSEGCEGAKIRLRGRPWQQHRTRSTHLVMQKDRTENNTISLGQVLLEGH